MRVACTLVIEDGKVLLVKEYKGWNLITEHAENDSGETLKSAAVRGVFEEAGYWVELTGCLGIIDTTYRRQGTTIQIFLARLMSDEQLPHEAGIEKTEWLSIDAVRAMPPSEWRFPTLIVPVLDFLESGEIFPLSYITEIPPL